MEAKILEVLRGAGSPLTADEISKKIPGTKKKSINQIIYKMGAKGVEQVHGTQPPKWRLINNGFTSSSGDGSTANDRSPELPKEGATPNPIPVSQPVEETPKSTDDQIKAEVERYLRDQKISKSAPDIYRAIKNKLNNCETADIKRVLGDMQIEGNVYNQSQKGQKPYWVWKGSGGGGSGNLPKQSTINGGKRLYTKEDTEDGGIKFNPVTDKDLNDDTPSVPPVTPSVPIPSSPLTPASIPPVSVPPSVPPSTNSLTPPPAATNNEGTTISSDSQLPKQAATPSPRPGIKLAANFGAMSLAESPTDSEDEDSMIRRKIREFFETKVQDNEELDAHTIATKLGYPTRDKVLYNLTILKDEGFLDSTNDKHFYKKL